jgi:hypothetical protein
MTDHHAHGTGHAEDSTIGVHGMLLFGDDHVYFSHLPMFAPPHNFQVLVEVGLSEPARESYLADRHVAVAGTYHTFVPEPFPIAELNPSGDGPTRTAIEGTIFRGHFERGGTAIAEGVTAEVRQIVGFSELDVDGSPAEDAELAYLCFGRAGRLHLVHEITARPSFDHVLTARLLPDTVTNQAGQAQPDDVRTRGFEVAQPVRVSGRRDTPADRLSPGETVEGLFFRSTSSAGAHGFRVQIEVGREIYLEVDELA